MDCYLRRLKQELVRTEQELGDREGCSTQTQVPGLGPTLRAPERRGEERRGDANWSVDAIGPSLRGKKLWQRFLMRYEQVTGSEGS